MSVEWGELPPVSNPAAIKHAEIAAQLKARPGEWARVSAAKRGAGRATAIKSGELAAYRPAGSFEATERNAGRDERGRRLFDTWARYVGDKAAQS